MRNITFIYFDPHTQEKRETALESAAHLRACLTEMQQGPKPKIGSLGGILLDEQGNEMDIGIVDDRWLLVLSIGPEVEEQYCSLGDVEREGEVDIYWEQLTSMRKKWLIDKDKAWEAVETWLKTGAMSNEITWSDETY